MDGKVNVKEKIRLKYKIIIKRNNIGLYGMLIKNKLKKL